MTRPDPRWPRLGAGLGLRPRYHDEVLAGGHPIQWFEVITENVLGPGGNPRRVLDAVCARWPVVLHGVSLGIGGPDPLDLDFLDAVRDLADAIEAPWVSDHLCWGSLGGHRAHDLWPLPLHEASLDHVTARVHAAQERLGRPLVLENVSKYLAFSSSTLSEGAFFAELVERTGCGVLLDVNNLVVNRHNLGTDPDAFLAALPVDCVAQIHLAGHEVHPTHRVDTHDHPIDAETWALYDRALARFGAVSTLIEWDDRFPAFEVLVDQVTRARERLDALEPV